MGLVGLVVVSALGAQQPARKKLLFLTHAGLYKHTSLGPAEKAVIELGKAGGFDVTTVEGYKQEAEKLDFSFFTPEYLAGFDGLMMMTNGNLPMTDAQKKSLLDFVRSGKGFIGAHCAVAHLLQLPGVRRHARRLLPPLDAARTRIGVLKVEDPNHPATKMLGGSWPLVDEFYHFGTAPWDAARPKDNIDVLFGNHIPMGFTRDRVHVLLSLDTAKTNIEGMPDVVKGGDYPQAWTREYGKGRSFYTSLGHRDDIWSNDPVFRAHINGGIRWALGLEN